MDKISKALETARKQRKQQNQTVKQVKAVINNDVQEPPSVIDNHLTVPTFSPDALLLEKNRIINNTSEESIVQPYKVLRTRLMQIIQDKGWKSIAVVSPTKNDGKSTVAVNLSISIGNSHKNNAVLLDLDLLTPNVHKLLGYETQYGLEEYFKQQRPLTDVLFSPDVEGLLVAPTIEPLYDSSEFLSTTIGEQLISEASDLVDNSVVIVDLPPILVSDDAISFLPHVDAVLLVIREGRTSKHDIEQAIEMLGSVNVAGVVMNDSSEPAKLGYYY